MRVVIFALLCVSLVAVMAFQKPRPKGMVGKYYRRVEMGGLCTRSIYFINDTAFSFEGGCEASSHHFFGRWGHRRDTFWFKCDTTLFINPVLRITSKQLPSDSVYVRVVDESGAVLPYFAVTVRNTKGGVHILPIDVADSLRKGARLSPGESLRLYALEQGYYKRFPLPTDSANYFEVVVRIPPNINTTSWSRVEYYRPFELIKRGDSLVSFRPGYIQDAAFNRVKW